MAVRVILCRQPHRLLLPWTLLPMVLIILTVFLLLGPLLSRSS